MPMTPLNRKLLRDLWRIKGQACAIAVVIAVGVLLLVMMGGLVTSLDGTRRVYYERYRFADVFAALVRAPDQQLDKLALIPGVARVEGRVVGAALIDLPGSDLPFQGRVVSLPDAGEPALNDIHLMEGRRLDSRQADEILLLDSFAVAHNLKSGDSLTASLKGVRRQLRVVGLAKAPEFLYATAPGEVIFDASRFAVIWLGRSAAEAAYDMDGAFNEVLLGLEPGARLAEVVRDVDRIIEPFGGRGAYDRGDHQSNRFIRDEIDGLKATSKSVPPIFLAVAAFLLYLVISRMVQAEREEIGLIKAFGYNNLEIGLHYFKLILAIAAGGALLGCLVGIAAGRAMIHLYLEFFSFPFLLFQLDPISFVTAFAVSVGCASAGGLIVLRRVFALAPAEAMRPPAPTDYSRSDLLGQRINALFDQPCRMVLRRLMRQPLRMLGAVTGIAFGMALFVAMVGILSGFERMMDLNFDVIDRSDVTVSFSDTVAQRTVYELISIPGVIEVEPLRSVPVVFHHGLRTYRGVLNGMVEGARLNRVMNKDMEVIELSRGGIILAQPLAKTLAAAPGDWLTVEVRDGRRPELRLPVVAVAETLLGAPAFMELGALNRALNEPGRIAAALLRIDATQSREIYRKLKLMPGVAAVNIKQDSRAALQKQIDSGTGSTRYVMALIAAIISFGIVYNAARIAYAERAHDLAILKVIGFTEAEVAFVLLGELAAVVLLALPLGTALGYLLSFVIAEAFSTDIYQVAVVLTAKNYSVAALAVISAAVVSGWLVKRDLAGVELVSALKSNE